MSDPGHNLARGVVLALLMHPDGPRVVRETGAALTALSDDATPDALDELTIDAGAIVGTFLAAVLRADLKAQEDDRQ